MSFAFGPRGARVTGKLPPPNRVGSAFKVFGFQGFEYIIAKALAVCRALVHRAVPLDRPRWFASEQKTADVAAAPPRSLGVQPSLTLAAMRCERLATPALTGASAACSLGVAQACAAHIQLLPIACSCCCSPQSSRGGTRRLPGRARRRGGHVGRLRLQRRGLGNLKDRLGG